MRKEGLVHTNHYNIHHTSHATNKHHASHVVTTPLNMYYQSLIMSVRHTGMTEEET
jgi:hypothetical protein